MSQTENALKPVDWPAGPIGELCLMQPSSSMPQASARGGDLAGEPFTRSIGVPPPDPWQDRSPWSDIQSECPCAALFGWTST